MEWALLLPMITQISEDMIRGSITRAVQDVFKTMLHHEVVFAGASSSLNADEGAPPLVVTESIPQVVGTVGFIGEANGLIYLYISDEFAKRLTGEMLGMTPDEVTEGGDEVVNDAIGEITNMTVGGFKNALCDTGFPCKLTIPSILRGSNFSVEPISSATRYIFHFNCAGHRLVTDILMKIGD
jgi:chemotaxis protein CheX